MKIKKMTARFGMLDGRTLELGDGLNVLYAPNESGKSTWCAFARTMLYGLSTAQRAKAGVKPDKVKYRPWSGAPMSGTMDVTGRKGPVTLSRWTERANQPMQAFSATVTGTETPVPGLSSDTVGEALTGVPREVFERSAFIRQAGLELTNDPELDRRIGAIVSTGDEEVSYIEVDSQLRSWLRHRRSNKRGAIPELEAEMARTQAKLDELRAQAGQTEAIEAELSSLEREQEAAVLAMQRARSEQRRRALADMSAVRAEAEKAREAVRAAEARRAETEAALAATVFGDAGPEEAARRSREDREKAAELAQKAEKRPPTAVAFVPLIAAALALLLALFVPWKAVCLGAGGLLLTGFAAALIRVRSLRKARESTWAERQRILDAYGVEDPSEIDGLLAEYQRLWTARERAEERANEASAALGRALDAQKRAEAQTLDGLDFTRGDTEAAQAGRRVERIRARIAELRERRASAEGRARATGDAMVLASELEEQRARHEELLRQEQALELAIETMAQADGELQQRFSPQLAKEAAALFSRLTDGRYDEVTLARDLTAKTRRAGDTVGWETDYLSAGAKDQLYLALRLAVCRLALPGEDPCPIVLDDALVNFDRERMARALDFLRELAEERQILLFTCHEREFDYFVSDAGVHRAVIT